MAAALEQTQETENESQELYVPFKRRGQAGESAALTAKPDCVSPWTKMVMVGRQNCVLQIAF